MTAESQKPPIRFRGRNFLALVVAPDPPLDSWLLRLDDWLTRAPAFFKGRPVILDLSAMELDRAEIPAVVAAVQSRNLRVMGVDGADVEWLGIGTPAQLLGGKAEPAPDFRATGTAPAPSPAPAAEAGSPEPAAEAAVSEAAGDGEPSSMIITEPLRSGQQIYCPRGDVTVVGAVQFGAEVVAGGSITVHGALRGRAIAGVGNRKARIFCRRFEAELLAIDGVYKTADDIDPSLLGKPVQAWLDGETLRTALLD